jgi:uncharacterized alpha/beta hydrolase family protein
MLRFLLSSSTVLAAMLLPAICLLPELSMMAMAKGRSGQRSRPKGHVTYTGHWDKHAKYPLVQVIFRNNHEGNYHRAASWINTIVNHLHHKYKIRQFNAVAHSYGNNAIAYYLATHNKSVKIHKLVDIASCINTDLQQDQAFKRRQIGGFATYVKEMKHDQAWYEGKNSPFLDKRFSVLNIYGTYQGKPSDGAVSHEAAQGLRKTFYGIKGTYQEKEFKGNNAQHSALTRRNPAVAAAIARFLK